jgi:hypothetical protein
MLHLAGTFRRGSHLCTQTAAHSRNPVHDLPTNRRMTKEELLELLQRAPSLSAVFNELVVEAVPWIFAGDKAQYDTWRRDAAAAVGLPSNAIYLVGSAAVGYSLSPFKPGRPFKPVGPAELNPSDIDIAVVDAPLFTGAWDQIVDHDRRRALGRIVSEVGYRRGTLSDAMAKVRIDIYHGTVTDVYAPPGSLPASQLRTLFAATSRRNPFRGHQPRARLYRRLEDFMKYHEQSLKQLRAALKP